MTSGPPERHGMQARWIAAVTDKYGQLQHEGELGTALAVYSLIIRPYTYQGTARRLLTDLASVGLALGPISEPPWTDRVPLIVRIASLWRGDWSGHSFDGRDGQRWLDTAVYGNAGDLAQLDEELTRAETWQAG